MNSEDSDLVKLLRAIPSTISLIGTDRTIRFANRLSSGYRPADVIGRDVFDFLPPEAQEEFAATFSRVLETGAAATYELPVLEPDGTAQWYGGTLAPVFEDGHVTAVVNIAKNISARVTRETGRTDGRDPIPVCSWCSKVRGASDEWQRIERYLEEKEGAPVTHSICPSCQRQMEGDLDTG